MSKTPARVLSRIRSARSARTIIYTSSTFGRTDGRWAIRIAWTVTTRPRPRRLTENTRVTLADEDAGPAKAWLVGQRDDPRWKPLFTLAYGKRPREELYDLKADPHQVKNVAAEPKYAQIRSDLERRLMDELKRTDDPRLQDDGKFFETPPMAGPVAEEQSTGKKTKTK